MGLITGQRGFTLKQKISAQPEEVFRQVTDPGCMSAWGGVPIRRIRDCGDAACGPNGPGSVRSVKMGPMELQETILSFDPPHAYEYTISKGWLVKNHRGKVSVTPDGSGSLLSWNVAFEPGIPLTGPLVAQSVKIGFFLGLKKLAHMAKKKKI